MELRMGNFRQIADRSCVEAATGLGRSPKRQGPPPGYALLVLYHKEQLREEQLGSQQTVNQSHILSFCRKLTYSL